MPVRCVRVCGGITAADTAPADLLQLRQVTNLWVFYIACAYIPPPPTAEPLFFIFFFLLHIFRLFFFCLLANVRNMLPDSTILYLFCKCRRLWWCRTGSARITSIDSPPRVPASSFHRGIRCGESPFTCRRTRISTTSS